MGSGNNIQSEIAIWAITPGGADLAERIAGKLPEAALFFKADLAARSGAVQRFSKLKDAVDDQFHGYPAHIFIMSTGIVVRTIAPLIRHKTEDPAVLAADEKGLHVISLLSGHIGGANALAVKVAGMIGADPVITTATDLNGVPAVDVLAKQKNLFIENPGAVKFVGMALIAGEPIRLHDPYRFFADDLKGVTVLPFQADNSRHGRPGVFIDHVIRDLPEKTLVLRPATLVAGIGCNRHTPVSELKEFLFEVLDRVKLSPASLKRLASMDLKADEAGLVALAEDLDLPIAFFTREELNTVTTIENPSAVVEKHVGVKSVCEAAAILGANRGRLMVPKQNTPNVTVAVAKIPFTSSASDPQASTI